MGALSCARRSPWRCFHRTSFLTAFAEAVLGLEHHELGQAAKAVDRLDKFLDHSSFGLRFTFHLALLVMPGGLLTKLRFAGRPLAWRRTYLDRLFLENIGRAPAGWWMHKESWPRSNRW